MGKQDEKHYTSTIYTRSYWVVSVLGGVCEQRLGG